MFYKASLSQGFLVVRVWKKQPSFSSALQPKDLPFNQPKNPSMLQRATRARRRKHLETLMPTFSLASFFVVVAFLKDFFLPLMQWYFYRKGFLLVAAASLSGTDPCLLQDWHRWISGNCLTVYWLKVGLLHSGFQGKRERNHLKRIEPSSFRFCGLYMKL